MSKKAIRSAIRVAKKPRRGLKLDIDKYPTNYLPNVGRQVMAEGGVPDPEIDHDLVNAATNHFGLTNRITEAGYVLSDGRMLDFSGRYEDPSYIKSGDSYRPKSGEDYMRDQRYTDHRNVSELLNAPSEEYVRDYISQALLGESPESLHPDELHDLRQEAIESYEGESVDGLDAVSQFIKRGKAARVYPGEGVEFGHVPTPRQINKIVSEHNKHYPNTPFNVDVVNPGGSSQAVPVSKTFSKANAEGIANWVREALSSMTPSKAEGGEVGTPSSQLNDLGLYSHGVLTAANLPQPRGTPQQYRSMLEKRGVKPDEFIHTGWDEAFANRPSVTREEVAQHFQQNAPILSETTASKYIGKTHYNTQGGKNYREVLLRYDGSPTGNIVVKDKSDPSMHWSFSNRNEAENFINSRNNPSEEYEINPENYVTNYKSPHWDTPNVVAHIRMKDRVGPNGEKILHVEEIQSDWAQQARRSGFMDSEEIQKANDDLESNKIKYTQAMNDSNVIRDVIASLDPSNREETERQLKISIEREKQARDNYLNSREKIGVENAPFVDNTNKWVDLAIKRVIKEAAHGDYDHVIFTSGDEQAERSQQRFPVKAIDYAQNKDGTYEIMLSNAKSDGIRLDRFKESWMKGVNPNKVTIDDIKKIFGEDVANKVSNNQSKPSFGVWRRITNVNKIIGGEGVKKFYDDILMKRLKETSKKIDPESKIQTTLMNFKGQRFGDKDMRGASLIKGDVPYIKMQITPKMKEAISRGLPMFAKGGKVGRQVMADGGFMRGQNYIPHDDPRRQDNFSNWFGYSHVVDDSGNPVVLYHGTDADFDEFDPGKAGQTDHGWYGEGHYLTANPELASAYSGYKNFKAIEGEEVYPGQNIMPVHVRLENPYYWPDDRPAATSKEEARKITEELRKKGHDGVIAPNRFDNNPLHSKFSEVVVFTPHQMKSAVGNNGNYNMKSARLNEASGGSVKGAFKPDGSLKSDKGYVYHGTNVERASQIAQEGMKLFDPSDFTNQDSWPDGSTNPRAYFSRNAGYVHSFLPEEGEGVVLRAKEPEHAKTEKYTNDVYVEKPIPPHEFEILNQSGEWEHLPSFFEEKVADGSVVDFGGPNALLHYLPVTEEMREKTQRGLPMFAKGGEVSKGLTFGEPEEYEVGSRVVDQSDDSSLPLSPSIHNTRPSSTVSFSKNLKKEKIKTNQPNVGVSDNSSVRKALVLTSSASNGRASRGTPR